MEGHQVAEFIFGQKVTILAPKSPTDIWMMECNHLYAHGTDPWAVVQELWHQHKQAQQSPMMQAKMQVRSVNRTEGVPVVELTMSAICGKPFDAEGQSEDNTYARWTPTADLRMIITNPVLLDKFKPGQTFYLNFTEAPATA